MRMTFPIGRTLLVIGGCVVLGVGVALLLSADLGSDGYSTLVNGVAQALDVSFLTANLAIGAVFLVLAALRGVYPGPGTLVQVVVVGLTVSVVLAAVETPGSLVGQVLLLGAAFPVLALGIAAYLGSQLGAGPTEAAALAWDPPLPFRWGYSIVQGGGALVGWSLGATVGAGTIAVIVLLGPAAGLAGRLLRLDLRQGVLESR
ncbi:hypothetical protein BH11ACT8_BH11ACT8_13570 [soil metagenome]